VKNESKIIDNSNFDRAAMACSKNDGGKELEMQNRPPKACALLQVANDTADVDVKPIFSWKPAIDPEDDTITYDLYLGTEPNALNVYTSSISSTSFEFTERLRLVTDYHWKVVANYIKEVRLSEIITINCKLDYLSDDYRKWKIPHEIFNELNAVRYPGI
jgi:hypothetical protein